MSQPSVNKYNMTKLFLPYFNIYLYFIMQCIKITHTDKNITIRVIKSTLKVKKRGIMFKVLKEKLKKERYWKERNDKYSRELQSFFDKADNINDENLKKKIVGQMLKCDEVLTQIAENRFQEFYQLGYNDAKKE